ncbi:MAG: tRNA (adenosine(37)-N6)-threonylcarbamoyltransferase complex ATPase subunit type 1 TsaE [Deltaproteobacteria bacterium]|nr:tRNA (adenosine(37)-N6)-threonylcarbamoyltransferase complex ATPase subunit type 1 TsaE [Deltaproteobacteria bacterium]
MAREEDASFAVALPTRRATLRLARDLAALLTKGDVVFLEGPLGAGKTFFVRGVCRALGVPSRLPIQSPTFALVNEHEGRLPIVHADLYRLTDASELDEIGLRDLLVESVGFVEWGERFGDAVAKDGVVLELALAAQGRRARVTARGARGRTIVEALARDLDPRVGRLAPP